MMQIPAELFSFGPQAWLLSVTGAALGATRIALWIKGSTGVGIPNNGNGKLMMAKEAGKFEGQVLELTKRVVDLTEEMHDGMQADRDTWGPAITNILTSQNRIMNMLDKHEERAQTMWAKQIKEFSRLVDKVATLPCTEGEEDLQ